MTRRMWPTFCQVGILLLVGVSSLAQDLVRETKRFDGSKYCTYEDGYVYATPDDCARTRDQVILPPRPWLTSERERASGRYKCSYSNLTAQRNVPEPCPPSPEARWNYVFANGPWISSSISTGTAGAPSITIHCQSESGNWYLSFGLRGYITATDNPVHVSIKFDDQERSPSVWLPTDTKSVRPKDSSALLKKILQHQTLELGVADYRNRWEYVTYNLGGPPPKQIGDACAIE